MYYMNKVLRIWMLPVLVALGIVSCTESVDNPANPIEPVQPELADYTIIYYSHGGANVDMNVLNGITDFYKAAPESYSNIKVAMLYKYSTEEHLKTFVQQYVDAGEVSQTEFNNILSMAGKSSRFILDPKKTAEEQLRDGVYGEWNADITCPDSLTNFINWAAQTCPAKNYILMLCDHGGGYAPDDEVVGNSRVSPATRAVIYDDGYNSIAFSATSLGQAIRASNVRPQAFYMNACLMNTLEYQFELKDLTDYLILSTFVQPAFNSSYDVFIDQLAKNGTDIEATLKTFIHHCVEGWDEGWAQGESPLYCDMTITRTTGLDQFGEKMREFTDRLIDAYQNGGAEIKARIDSITGYHAFRVANSTPNYDVARYIEDMRWAAPDYITQNFYSSLAASFNACVVDQCYTRYLSSHGLDIDCSVLLAQQGIYYKYDWQENSETKEPVYVQSFAFKPDGTIERWFAGEDAPSAFYSWGSTLADTYGRLAFDRATGWSRWLMLNEQLPTPLSPVDFKLDIFDDTFNK